MSAACAWTDFLQTSGNVPASFRMPPRWPPMPTAHVLQVLLVASRFVIAAIPPASRPFASE
jgi:hypothetical protein